MVRNARDGKTAFSESMNGLRRDMEIRKQLQGQDQPLVEGNGRLNSPASQAAYSMACFKSSISSSG